MATQTNKEIIALLEERLDNLTRRINDIQDTNDMLDEENVKFGKRCSELEISLRIAQKEAEYYRSAWKDATNKVSEIESKNLFSQISRKHDLVEDNLVKTVKIKDLEAELSQLSEHIKDLEIELSVKDEKILRLEKDNAEAETYINTLEDAESTTNETLNKNLNKLLDSRAEADDLRNEGRLLEKENADLLGRLKEAQKLSSKKDEKIDAIEDYNRNLHKDINIANSTISGLQVENDSLRKEKADFIKDLDGYDGEFVEYLEGLIRKAEEERDEESAKVTDLEKEKERLSDDLRSSRATVDYVRDKIDEKNKDLRKAKNENDALQSSLKHFKDRVNALEEDKECFIKNGKYLENLARKAEEKKEKLVAKVTDLERQITAHERTVSTLKETVTYLTESSKNTNERTTAEIHDLERKLKEAEHVFDGNKTLSNSLATSKIEAEELREELDRAKSTIDRLMKLVRALRADMTDIRGKIDAVIIGMQSGTREIGIANKALAKMRALTFG